MPDRIKAAMSYSIRLPKSRFDAGPGSKAMVEGR
jgi:hypothetical protein